MTELSPLALAGIPGLVRCEQFDREAPFFQSIANDPMLSRVKLIAEPWDLGPHGYQIGGFPAPWRELNGRYRDRTRCFWLQMR